MPDNFDVAIKQLLEDEGSKIIPEDHGRGESKYGITLKTAQEFYPDWTDENITSLTEERAIEFYRMAFWDKYHFAFINDTALASKVFNEAVNIGPATAIRILQHTVASVITDGMLGPYTAHMVNMGNAAQILAAFKQGVEAHHKRVAASNPELADDLEGWLKRDEA